MSCFSAVLISQLRWQRCLSLLHTSKLLAFTKYPLCLVFLRSQLHCFLCAVFPVVSYLLPFIVASRIDTSNRTAEETIVSRQHNHPTHAEPEKQRLFHSGSFEQNIQ